MLSVAGGGRVVVGCPVWAKMFMIQINPHISLILISAPWFLENLEYHSEIRSKGGGEGVWQMLTYFNLIYCGWAIF